MTQTNRVGRPIKRRFRAFMAQPSKNRTSGIFYIRRKVPKALQGGTLGREYKRSFGTRDLAEAKRLFAEAFTRSEEVFALAKAQAQGAEVLSIKDINILAARWLTSEQAAMESSGNFDEWLVTDATDAEEGEAAARPQSLREWRKSDPDFSLDFHVDKAARQALKLAGIPWPSRAEKRVLLLDCFQEHLLNLSDLACSRLKGDWMAAANLPKDELLSNEVKRKQAAPRPQGRKLSELFDRYKGNRLAADGDSRASKKSIEACRVNTEQFIQLMGDLSMAEITREVVHEYREKVSLLPAKGVGLRTMSLEKQLEAGRNNWLPRISAATVRNKIKFLSAVFSVGVRLNWLTENPIIAGGLSGDVTKAATRSSNARNVRRDYNSDELKKIFISPIFDGSGWAPPRAEFGEAWLWLPLLMYYTGARREELAQLKAREVIVRPGEPAHLDIMTSTEEGDARGVKNDGSRRLIPLHPALIERGFLDYVETVRSEQGQLFPKLKPSPKGYYGASFGKRWAIYLREVVKLETTVLPAHGFRHTFKTLCRRAGIQEDVSDAITGHAGGNRVARSYGTMPLERMATEIARLPKA